MENSNCTDSRTPENCLNGISDDFQYISLEAAIERFCNVYCGCSPEECGFKIPHDGAEECAAVRALKEVPAADVVEVVRCKDCRYYYKDDDEYEMCDNSEGYDHISADGYCAWAVRRADNGC